MNVLIVEDSRSIRNLIQAFVTDLGHSVICAETGEEGLVKFKSNNISLVLMDIELPGMNGFEVTREIRSHLNKDWVPIIFLSAQKSDAHFVEGINAGGDAYLFKPVNGPVLQSMVAAMGRIASTQEQLQRVNKQLEEMAYIDQLTELFNRRGMLMSLGKEWARASRNKKPLSVLIMDVDHFKAYNDHYGHLKGDHCLKKVAKALNLNTLRPCDLACRYGGEEFLIVLPDTDLRGAIKVANRVQESLKAEALPHEKSPTSEYVTISIGVAEKKEDASPEGLLMRADKNLYQAKETGRNKIYPDDVI